jgi:hypothetical protein
MFRLQIKQFFQYIPALSVRGQVSDGSCECQRDIFAEKRLNVWTGMRELTACIASVAR